jgi:ribonuclease D
MKLKGVELAVLQALVEVRDETARARNRPVFKVIPNDALMAWAAKPPETADEVVNTPGVSRHYMERLAPSILKAVKGALALSSEEWPQKPPPEPRQVLTPEETKALDKLKAARAKTAEELGIDPGLLGNTAMLTRLAKTSRDDFEQVLKKELKNWQMEVAGGALLAALD